MKKSILIIIGLFAVCILLITLFPNLNNDFVKHGKLYINRILAINSSIRQDDYGEYSDYIEIYNAYAHAVDLSGYHLSDSEFQVNKWTFPDIIINGHDSLIIYASGHDSCDLNTNVCHTNFKLSSHGEIVTLTDKSGNIISKVKYPEQYPDVFYGYKNGKYVYLSVDGKIVNKQIVDYRDYELEITEYMTHNKRSFYDIYGNYYDWIEIHNNGVSDYLLDGLYITDDVSNLKKYALPGKIIKKDEYMIIYLAGKKVNYSDGIYASFGLSDDDKEIIISNGINIIDRVPIVKLVDNISYGKSSDGWKYYTTATPGMINATNGFDSWGGNNGSS